MRLTAIFAAAGAVLAGGLALIARGWRGGHADLGWWGSGTPRRYVDYLPSDLAALDPDRPWWPVFAALGAGLVFGALVGLALHLFGFRLVRGR